MRHAIAAVPEPPKKRIRRMPDQADKRLARELRRIMIAMSAVVPPTLRERAVLREDASRAIAAYFGAKMAGR